MEAPRGLPGSPSAPLTFPFSPDLHPSAAQSNGSVSAMPSWDPGESGRLHPRARRIHCFTLGGLDVLHLPMLILAVFCAHVVLMIGAVLVVGRKPVQWAGAALFLAGCFWLEWLAPLGGCHLARTPGHWRPDGLARHGRMMVPEARKPKRIRSVMNAESA